MPEPSRVRSRGRRCWSMRSVWLSSHLANGEAGPLEGGAYRGGVQAGPEGAGASRQQLTQEAGAARQAGWSSGAWSQGERWVRRRGQKHNLVKLRPARDPDSADKQLHGLGTKPEHLDHGFPLPISLLLTFLSFLGILE